MKRLSAILCAVIISVVMACPFAMTAFAESTAYEINALNMSVPVPDEMIVLTRDSKDTDPFFTTFKLNYETTMSQLIDGNIYLEAVDKDSNLTLTVTMAKTEESQKIVSYSSLSDEELSKIMTKLRENESYKDASPVEYKGIKYLCLNMSYKSGKKTVQAQQYNTVMNGENINITIQAAAGKKLTTANKELLAGVVEETTILEDNFFNRNRSFILYGSITLAAIVVIAVVLILLLKYFRNPDRKHKILVHELAHEHKISKTTQIPRKHILDVIKPTNTFLSKYEPVDEIGKKKRKKKSEVVAEQNNEIRSFSEPVPEEAAEPEEKMTSVSYEDAPDEIEVPVTNEEISGAVAATAENVEASNPETQADNEKYEDKPEAAVEQEPEEKPVEETKDESDLSELVGDVPVEQAEVTPEESDEKNFNEAADYFDVDPEEGQMYSYQDVDTAVKDYSRAKRQRDEEDNEDIPRAWDTVKKVLIIIGVGIVKVFKAIFVGIVYIVTHLGYFCVNLYRMIKRNRKESKRRKAEEERRRQASERRRMQREAERARQRNNANRGENDLVQVRSSYERYERRPAATDRTRAQSSRTRSQSGDRRSSGSSSRRSTQSRNSGQRRF